MDVMLPELMWIDGRCYRIPIFNPKFSSSTEEEQLEPYREEESDNEELACGQDSPCDVPYEITVTKKGQYSSSFHVPRAYWPFIVGSKGATRKRVESETKTQVFVPKQAELKDVIITGNDRKSVVTARRRVELIIMSSRQKLQFTHFLSIPVNDTDIRNNFNIFKTEVLAAFGNSRGVDESIFQKPEKLHLTLATLMLADNEERNTGTRYLNECSTKIIEPVLVGVKPLIIEMSGIEYMNDDPAEVDVLYGKVALKKNPELLQILADNIVHYFNDTGLVHKESTRSVKLHVTLMNTLFRGDKIEEVQEGSYSGNSRFKKREHFDATGILKKFENFYFGEQVIRSIHLSQRYSTGADGYYQYSAIVDL